MEIWQIIGGILLLLLKIIGILLLILIVILLLLILVPISWKLKAFHQPDTALTQAQAHFEVKVWGGIIRMLVSYEGEAALRLSICGLTAWRQNLLSPSEDEKKGQEAQNQTADSSIQTTTSATDESSVDVTTEPAEAVAAEQPAAVRVESEAVVTAEPETEEVIIAEVVDSREAAEGRMESERLSFTAWIGRGLGRILQPFRRLYQKIAALVARLRELGLGILQKTEMVSAYWEWLHSDPVRQLLQQGFTTLRKLLRHFRPRKGRGWLVFGVGDPMNTAVLYGMTTELWTMKRMKVDATPSLEERRIDGELILQGHLILGYIGWLVLRLIIRKELRKSLATRPQTQAAGQTIKEGGYDGS